MTQKSKNKKEQRLDSRKKLQTRVLFCDEFSKPFLYFLSKDISVSGIFIESPLQILPHSKAFLQFSLYEGDPALKVTAEVMRLQENFKKRGRPPKKSRKKGIGFRFMGLSDTDKERIAQFIAS